MLKLYDYASSGNCYKIRLLLNQFDIALYAYTHVAAEGGFELERFPAILAWFDRIIDRPNHLTIAA